jgi:hypothetical protein
MPKEKKPKEIEKLRKILDNPFAPGVKKVISEDDRILDSVRKRLSDELLGTKPKGVIPSYDFLLKKPQSLEPRVTIHRKEEEIILPETEPPTEEYIFEVEDLYEVEKIEVSEPEFIEVKPEEITPEETIKDTEEIDETLPEWEPVEPTAEIEDRLLEKKVYEEAEEEKELPPERRVKKEREVSEEEISPVDVFKEIKSIDGKTAGLLYDHGYTSIEKIKDATIKDLCKIRGVRRRLAKKIKKEIHDLETSKEETIEERKISDKWESYPTEEIGEIDEMAYTCGDYTLYKKEIVTYAGKKRTIHFFSREKPEIGEPVPLPDGYEVKVNKKTGLPYLKKKK